jgi:YidC/Oxa1 family membrane protein insertase
MRDDNKNLIMAIALSVAVLIGWNYFVGSPLVEKQKQSQPHQAPTTSGASSTPAAAPREGQPSTPPASTVPGTAAAPAVESREAALARSPRIRIDTPALSGSLALKGGRVDDVSLKGYRETVDPNSPQIVLLSPAGSPTPYYAEFGWVGPGAPGADTLWTADSQELTPAKPITLSFDNGQGLVFRRRIAIDDKFVFTIADTVENKGSTPANLNAYGLVSRHGKPATQGYYVLHEGMVGVVGDNGLQEYGYAALDKEPYLQGQPTRGKLWNGATGGFLGITDKYWAAAVLPDQAQPYQGSFTSREENKQFTYQANVLGETKTVAPGQSLELTQRLFAGAKEVVQINEYQQNLGIKKFDLLIDWGWFYFITKPMFLAIDFFFKMFGNFGVSILIVTVILKLFFLPLANKSYVSMAKMKAVQPEMTAIRERYKEDKVKQQQEMMTLYKREKINPVAGCWPILIQIPVFFALYKVLFVTIEMRHAPFFGWIKDLAAPDPTSLFNLFGLIPFEVPHFLHIGVWPIIMGITMFLQMKMNPEPPDPVQKAMFSWMPLIFTFMLASFPAGLVIYWAWNNLLSVTQQYVIMRRNGVKVELWDNLRGMFAKKKPADAPSSPR